MSAPLHVLFILNPVSGPTRTPMDDWTWLLDLARENGSSGRIVTSKGRGDIERLVREGIEQGVKRIVVIGGDGSINEAIQVMANTPVELGIIPGGTSNILANELGLSGDYRTTARMALTGLPREIDLGIANGRYFALMVGVGYDALVTETMWPQLKKLAGHAAYTVAGIQSFLKHRASRMSMQIDDKPKVRRLVYMLVIANTRLYGLANATVAENADVQDGLLDLCVFRARTWYHVIISLLRVLGRIAMPFERVESHRIQRLRLRSARKVPYQLDGDPAGYLPLEVHMSPRALRVITPAP